jgi:4'-phosphopantetheinyl transferase
MQIFVFVAEIGDPKTKQLSIEQLSETERLRAQDIKSGKRRREFVSGRLLAQRSLAALYGDAAVQWSLQVAPDGSLIIKGGSANPLPAISLSHSNGKVVCAVAPLARLGVDVEQMRARLHLEALAGEILHPDELAWFSGLDASEKLPGFYAKWVLKEALGKALGCGINYPMQAFRLEQNRLLAAPQTWLADPAHWGFSHTLLACGYSLGLAWQGDPASHVSIKTIDIRI